MVVLAYPDNLIEKVLVAPSGLIGADARFGSRTTGPTYLIIDAAAAPGSSGGPIFNRDGKVVGFVSLSDDSFTYGIKLTGSNLR